MVERDLASRVRQVDRVVSPKRSRGDRRSAVRYSLALRLTFQTAEGIRGDGAIVDLSSTGLRFKTDRPVQASSRISVAVEWPAKYRNVHTMELQLQGVVVRFAAGEVAVAISRYALGVTDPRGMNIEPGWAETEKRSRP